MSPTCKIWGYTDKQKKFAFLYFLLQNGDLISGPAAAAAAAAATAAAGAAPFCPLSLKTLVIDQKICRTTEEKNLEKIL